MAFMKDGAELTRLLVQWACENYGFDPKQYHSNHEDFVTGRIKMAFKPRRSPPELVELANKIHDTMNDPLRGEVVRAAVPELAGNAAALADLILNPKMHVVEIDPYTIRQLTKL